MYGFGWLGEKRLPEEEFTFKDPAFKPGEYTHTIAIRIYGSARGIHLSSPFQQATISHYITSVLSGKAPPYGIWAEIDVRNVSSIKMTTSNGFKEVAKNGKKALLVGNLGKVVQ